MDYLGARPGPPLRFASFSFNFSGPPWVFGIHDCMVYADLTVIMRTVQSFFSYIVLQHNWCQMFAELYFEINYIVRLSVQYIKWTNEWFMCENFALHLYWKIMF